MKARPVISRADSWIPKGHFWVPRDQIAMCGDLIFSRVAGQWVHTNNTYGYHGKIINQINNGTDTWRFVRPIKPIAIVEEEF